MVDSPLLWASIVASVICATAFVVELLRRGAAGAPKSAAAIPCVLRVLWPLIVCLAWLLRPLMSAQWRHDSQVRLARAGLERTFAPQHVLALQILSSFTMIVLVAVPTLFGVSFSLALAACAGLIGAGLPILWLRDTARVRKAAVLRALPYLIDLLAMAVEAGLPLSAAFAQSVERLAPGPLREECVRVVRDVQAGRSRDEALRAFAARLDLSGATQLVMALLAAQRDGGGIVSVLRSQAEQQRNERFLRAEHKAAQAPVRLLFPLLLFIFPGTLAVLLYPVVSRMMAEMGRWQ